MNLFLAEHDIHRFIYYKVLFIVSEVLSVTRYVIYHSCNDILVLQSETIRINHRDSIKQVNVL